MIRLRTLGALDLVASDGRRVDSVLAQPKRLALLVYLATAGPGEFRRRDTLLALLWPDLDQQKGRRSLRQAVYVLRRALGSEAIVSRGDEELAVDSQRLACDVTEFRQRIEDGRAAEALRVYGGEFLVGFHVEAAPEFSRWLDEVRATLRRSAADAAWALAEAAADRGDRTGAADWARIAAGHAGADETAIARLMEYLERAGDYNAAVKAYDEYAARIEQDLDLEPSRQLQERVRGIREREGSDRIQPAGVDGSASAESAGEIAPARAAPAATPSRRPRWLALASVSVVVVLVAGLVWTWASRSPSETTTAPHLDPTVVAVVPFRVRGAEAELGYLSEGMVELVSAVLTGQGTLRSVDPGSVLRQWIQVRPESDSELSVEQARRVARDVGAGKLLVGGLAGTPTQLLVNATLIDVVSGETVATARAAGIEDSLTRVVDRLTAELLAGSAGEPPDRLADLLTRSPLALRSYLSGQAAYRAGGYEEAFRHFQRAVELDSTFGIAAMQASEAAGYTAHPEISQQPYQRLAWKARDRMSVRDRAYLTARLGPSFPLPSTWRDLLAAAESAAVIVPDRPEVWYVLGDLLFHYGPVMGLDRSVERSVEAFRRSLAIDSLFAGAALHLVDLHLLAGDTSRARGLVARQMAIAPAGEPTDYMRWRLSQSVGDTATLESLRERFDDLHAGDLWRIWAMSQEAGYDLADADRAAATVMTRATTGLARAAALGQSRILALNRGRPIEARRLSAARGQLAPREELRLRVLHALHWDADLEAGEAAIDTLALVADAPRVADSMLEYDQFIDVCVVALWRLERGDLDAAGRAAHRLRTAASRDSAGFAAALRGFCAPLLEAMLAVERGQADAGTRVADLVSLSLTGPRVYEPVLQAANLIVARLYERLDSPDEALAALWRRPFFLNRSMSYLSTYLREEGRIAAVVGDTARAIRAYRHYLVLRADPEPALAPEAGRVADALARLEASRAK